MENKDFDKFIRKGLENVQPDYDPNDWDDMEDLLDKDERESKELIYIKGIELVLVLLTVVTLFRFYPDTQPIANNPFHAENTIVTPMDAMDDGEMPHTSEEKNIENELEADIDEKVISETLPTTTPISKSNITADKNYITPSVISTIQNPTTAFIPSKTSSIIPVAVPSIGSRDIGEALIQNTTKTTQYIQLIQASTIPSFSILDNTDVPSLSILPNNSSRSFFELTAIEKAMDDELDFGIDKKKVPLIVRKPEFRLSYHAGLDRNFIKTPFDVETGRSFSQGNFGFSSSLTASIKKGRWEFETGLGYNRKSYNPNPIYEITGNARDGYEAETLKELTFNNVSIPLNLRYYFSNMERKWNFYLTSGMGFNAVAWSNYNRYTYVIKDGNDPYDVIGGRPPKNVDFQKAGFLRGESVSDSYYMTANLGFGAELNLGERTHFFAQPKFTYYLMPSNNGLGPNNDQFNSLSLDIGFRFKL